ncbi:hypothetical protein B0H14DRAFT_2641239 [Mycena olivaceomarginata]|nr:hypothetical protein B0H14DRAFT_2641239 [Mycena olivaceomarginata]
MSALLSGMDEGDAYLPRIHLFVTHEDHTLNGWMLVLNKHSGQAGGREYGDEGRGGREGEPGGGGGAVWRVKPRRAAAVEGGEMGAARRAYAAGPYWGCARAHAVAHMWAKNTTGDGERRRRVPMLWVMLHVALCMHDGVWAATGKVGWVKESRGRLSGAGWGEGVRRRGIERVGCGIAS